MKTLILILTNAVLVSLFLVCVMLAVSIGLEMNLFALVPLVWSLLILQGLSVVQEMLFEEEEKELD